MAGLTKEKLAEREAATKQSNGTASLDPTDEQSPGKMTMHRSDPLHPGGPVTASVNEDEVERWKEEGWLITHAEEEESC